MFGNQVVGDESKLSRNLGMRADPVDIELNDLSMTTNYEKNILVIDVIVAGKTSQVYNLTFFIPDGSQFVRESNSRPPASVTCVWEREREKEREKERERD